jgi:hypothetical protein
MFPYRVLLYEQLAHALTEAKQELSLLVKELWLIWEKKLFSRSSLKLSRLREGIKTVRAAD